MLVGRDDDVVRGAFALRQRAPHRLDCGYVLARPWWRQGLMTEVLTEVSAWALRPAFGVPHRRGVRCREHRIGSCIGKIWFRPRGPAAPMVAASEH